MLKYKKGFTLAEFFSPHCAGHHKVAFTLAEVLITLGIIGVVAALTLSTLITDYQKKVTIKKLRTTYNILNNAIEMAKTEYGTDVNYWDMPDTNDQQILSNYFAEHYMLPYLKVVRDCKNGSICRFYGYSTVREFVLSNGTIVLVNVSGVGKNVQNVRTQIYIYINGKVNNINYARDKFLVELGGGTGNSGLDKNKFWPYGYMALANCDVYKNIDNTACNKTSTNKYRCFALIMCEGWKIPPDYPW